MPHSMIEKIAVVGAGVMGSGIAAHCANAGFEVLLLDIVPDGAADRSALAKGALARMAKADPAPFMSKRAQGRVTPGNLEDDLAKLADVDWIVEAVLEVKDVKQALYAKLEAVRKDGSIVSSNTSTIPLADLVEGMPARFAGDFLISHFFNPPRYMRLLELVAGEKTRSEALAALTELGDKRLGKGVVLCHDTPGFIANRIGTYWVKAAAVEARRLGLTVEEADAVMGRPFGIPRTGVFGLMDLVGLDLIPKVEGSMMAALPASDAYHALHEDWPLLERMLAEGYTGRKGKGGFYRLERRGGERIKQALNLETGDYAPAEKVRLESLEAAKAGGRKLGLKALISHPDKGGRYAWSILSKVVAYAASLVPEIADDIAAVDEAMRLGYNWGAGPFELADKVGAETLAAGLEAEGAKVPTLLFKAAEGGGFYKSEGAEILMLCPDGGYAPLPEAEGVLSLAAIKRATKPLAKTASASLWDLGDGVTCFEVHTKLNTLDPEVFKLIPKAIAITAAGHRAMVVGGEAAQFSAGANIGLGLFAANVAAWPMLEDFISTGQQSFMALREAPFPVVAATSGLVLGGGCELMMHCDAVQAHAESYVGLVEVGVGLVPGWGGSARLLERLSSDPRRPKGPMPAVAAAFEAIGTAKVAKSAFEALELGFLVAGRDDITFNRARLLADAKAKALSLVEGYAPPEPAVFRLPGPTGVAALNLALHDFELKGLVTPHDKVVAGELGRVLTGGPEADHSEEMTEAELKALEKAAFMALVRQPKTLARMEHTLDTGKPLRN